MGRSRSLRSLAAWAALAAALPAGAANVTTVASSGDPDRPFEVDVTVRYAYTQRNGTITQEGPGSSGQVQNFFELSYRKVTSVAIGRLAVGLWHDLEFHAEIPYLFADDVTWKYAAGVDDTNSGVYNNGIDANGLPAGTPGSNCPAALCPIFPVSAAGSTVYHGGLGDFMAGLAWGILSERRDDTKPTWVLGVDVTMPTASRYDPTTASAHLDRSSRAPVGAKLWTFDVYTALSRQLGPVDPYVKLHARLPLRTGSTYSNCDNAAALGAGIPPAPQMTHIASANCADPGWQPGAAAQPPTVVGMLLGAEFIPYEDRREQSRISIDLRVGADWVSSSRWYNELTDATGKLLYGQGYLTVGALLGLYVRASRLIEFQLVGTFARDLDHALTGEPAGRTASSTDASVVGTTNQNPNFDFRYDVPGRRFSLTGSNVYGGAGSFILRFY
jgi:hypothetical protein